ncbi:hypothetical protein BJX62DRAFT_235333 [Aspergillus germanicus]
MKGSRVLNTWFYEILAAIFSIGCFIAIVAILIAYDGKPTRTFAYSLTPNTPVSILATASKAPPLFMIGECTGQLKWLWFYKGEGERQQLSGMQLFDRASRGPLGALWVLFRHRGRSLVSLGAVVMVLSTPYDAFVQQILTYPIRNTVIATNTSQAPAQRAASMLLPLLGPDEEDIMQIGQWSDNLLVDPTCPSGNCTWPLFQSVKMCSECKDITNSTYLYCLPLPVNTTIGDDVDSYPFERYTVGGLHGVGYTEITLQGNEDGNFNVDIPLEQVWVQSLWRWRDDELPYPAGSIGHAQIGVAKQQFFAGYPPDLDIGSILEVTRATECTLRLCARTYNLTVSGGAVSIAKGEPDYGAQFWVNRRNGTVFPGKHPEWDAGSAFTQANYATCWRPTDGPAVRLTQDTESTTWVNAAEMAFCPAGEFLLRIHLEGERRGPDPSIKRIRTIGLEESMSRIAASFTRQALLVSNTTVEGTVYIPEVYVSVEWVWILHPAGLTGLAVVFLVSTMLVNHQRGLEPW